MTTAPDLLGWPIARTLLLADWAASVASKAGLLGLRPAAATAPDQTVVDYLKDHADPRLSALHHIGEMPSLGNISIDFLGDAVPGQPFVHGIKPPPGTRAMLKRSSNSGGTDSLRRQRERLEMLHAQDIGGRFGFLIPAILAFVDTEQSVWSIETYIPGLDGRILLKDGNLRHNALVSAGNLITSVQTAGPDLPRADDEWVGEWVDRSSDILLQPVRTIMTDGARAAAVASLKQRLAQAFRGSAIGAGWYHGDFSPGNLLYAAPAGGQGVAHESRIAAIIDWDRSGRNAPVGFDVCQLAVTARRALTGRQLGAIVVDLLKAGTWNVDERNWMSRVEGLAGPHGAWIRDPTPMRAMVLLVWVRQILANIEKYDLYVRNRLWSAANVEWVLRYILRNPV